MNKLFAFLGNIFKYFTIIMAVLLIMYSCYVLFDTFHTTSAAFVSYDILKYKPNETPGLSSAESFKNLSEINKNITAWISVKDTHIDYPVVRGADNLEYASKDIYGNGSITGSIYLDSRNNKNFIDFYNIVYGHHMENGAMFGDLTEFPDKDYFEKHNIGTLSTADSDYVLNIFAVLECDAYNSHVYGIIKNNDIAINNLIEYLENNSSVFDKDYVNNNSLEKIVVLSTCENAVTNGRVLVFANAVKTDSLPVFNTIREMTSLVPIGHDTLNAPHWALINLLCVFLSVIVIFPIFMTGPKYRQKKYAENLESKFSDYINTHPEDTQYKNNKTVEKLHIFSRRIVIGTAIEIILAVFGAVFFIITENMAQSMVLSDKYTWVNMLLVFIAILTDIIFFTYRGPRDNIDN